MRLGRTPRRIFTDFFFRSQDGRCAICGRNEEEAGPLELDHDHTNGVPRGMLCGTCNRGLGHYEKRMGDFEAYLANDGRLNRTEMFLRAAHLFAQQSTCSRGAVGAVIVRENRIVAHGYNGAPSGMPHCLDVGCIIGPTGGCIRASHAEMNAITYAARRGIAPLESSEVYSTHSPCLECARLMITAGISKVTFHKRYRDESGINLLKEAGVQVRGIG